VIWDLLLALFGSVLWFGPSIRRTMPKPSRTVMARLREMTAEQPNAWLCVVQVRRESPEWSEGILAVDGTGLILRELPSSETVLPWAQIADVRVMPRGNYNTELIHVTGRDGETKLRFGAVETNTYELTSEQLWDLAAQIRALRADRGFSSGRPED
jgi:hypothetical protein